MPPRTIDNLGIDVSTQHALSEGQKQLAESMSKEAPSVQSQAEVDVFLPAYSSVLDALLNLGAAEIPWAIFYSPEKFQNQRKRLFTHSLMPSIESEDVIDTLIQRIQATGSTDEEAQKQGKVLIFCLERLKSFNKILAEINARRNQYHKG